jgi:hypothetical protein
MVGTSTSSLGLTLRKRQGMLCTISMGYNKCADFCLHFTTFKMTRPPRAIEELLRRFAEEDAWKAEANKLYWSRFVACPRSRASAPQLPTRLPGLLGKHLQEDAGNPLPSADRPQYKAQTRAGGTCRKKVIPGRTRCVFHGGKSTGPMTESGKARIAEAQRRRWAKWRRDHQQMAKGVPDGTD